MLVVDETGVEGLDVVLVLEVVIVTLEDPLVEVVLEKVDDVDFVPLASTLRMKLF